MQYLLSLGNFSNGGELCIEESPFQVCVEKSQEGGEGFGRGGTRLHNQGGGVA
jgi:hypothetical protein